MAKVQLRVEHLEDRTAPATIGMPVEHCHIPTDAVHASMAHLCPETIPMDAGAALQKMQQRDSAVVSSVPYAMDDDLSDVLAGNLAKQRAVVDMQMTPQQRAATAIFSQPSILSSNTSDAFREPLPTLVDNFGWQQNPPVRPAVRAPSNVPQAPAVPAPATESAPNVVPAPHTERSAEPVQPKPQKQPAEPREQVPQPNGELPIREALLVSAIAAGEAPKKQSFMGKMGGWLKGLWKRR